MGILGTIGGVVGSYWGPAGTAIGTAAGSALDESMKQDAANKYNSAEAVSAYNRQREARQTAYQDTMSDLQKAGLNPMLAVTNGVTQLPSSAAASYPTGAGAASVSSVASAVQAANETQKTDAMVSKTKQEIVNLKTDNERVSALIDNVRQEYQNLVKQGYNLTEVGNQIRANISKLQAEVPLLRTTQFLKELEAQLSELDVAAAKKFDNFGREYKQYAPIIELLKHVFRFGHLR